jgi:hypothetical protein
VIPILIRFNREKADEPPRRQGDSGEKVDLGRSFNAGRPARPLRTGGVYPVRVIQAGLHWFRVLIRTAISLEKFQTVLVAEGGAMRNFSPVRKIGSHWAFLTGEKNWDAMELLIDLEIFYLLKTGKFTIK